MNTEVIIIDENQINEDQIRHAGRILEHGGLVAFPTETVYGLGGDALNPSSSEKIYAAKGRPSDNPLIVHIGDMADLQEIVMDIPEKGKQLADAFWPGPLTMVFSKSDKVPYETTGGLDTVAVRMPIHPVALSLIKAAGGYVAAPSANLSGKPSPTRAKYVIEDMYGKIDVIIDGGDVEIGLESTIIDVTGDVPMLLRPGFITKEMAEAVIGEIAVDPTLLDGACKEKPKAPGMKYKHYAPKGDLTIVSGEQEAVVREINILAKAKVLNGEKVGIIGTIETMDGYEQGCVKCIGSRQDGNSIAKSLFRILREFDDEDVTVIYSESFAECSVGQAIMNRLLKAAGHQMIFVVNKP